MLYVSYIWIKLETFFKDWSPTKTNTDFVINNKTPSEMQYSPEALRRPASSDSFAAAQTAGRKVYYLVYVDVCTWRWHQACPQLSDVGSTYTHWLKGKGQITWLVREKVNAEHSLLKGEYFQWGWLAKKAVWELGFERREEIWQRYGLHQEEEERTFQEFPQILINRSDSLAQEITSYQKGFQVPANDWIVNNAVQIKKVLEQWKTQDIHQFIAQSLQVYPLNFTPTETAIIP